MIPFFAGRVKLLGKDMRGKGKVIAVEDPLADFKRLYYDTAFFNVPSLKLLLEFVGEDHVVMGTDYPFGQRAGRACYEETLQMINRALTCEQREKVCKLNMTKLLHR
ncbi:hypothetical protein HS1genome_0549 [Sulfodiicoccus acidiphilus]|nr:amidohydrolase family protein [Sulfodiicoccus acidiphilus]BBD72160.1 hypothetical protein HS1genome_0549 [Sulfodiicoccus acidiphilus]